MAQKSILVTGGAGYIGSHTVLQLLLGGFKAVVIDNLDNSSEIAISRVTELAGDFRKNLVVHKVSSIYINLCMHFQLYYILSLHLPIHHLFDVVLSFHLFFN